jgi:hypothetical protein
VKTAASAPEKVTDTKDEPIKTDENGSKSPKETAKVEIVTLKSPADTVETPMEVDSVAETTKESPLAAADEKLAGESAATIAPAETVTPAVTKAP